MCLLLQAFKCGDKSETVHAIAPVDDDQAWICCGWGSRTLHLYDRLGHKKKSATLDIQVYIYRCIGRAGGRC